MSCQPDASHPEGPVLLRAATGEVSPLYFDRQVIRAEDLTLDRQSHERELARMRLYLHGWGVVAGLIPVLTGEQLTLSKGYGITWTGDEIFLPEAVSVPQIVARVWGCCGPGQASCEVIGLEERRKIAAEREQGEASAFLIVRPVVQPGGYRPTLAQGCSAGGAALLPSRACHQVSLELLCDLPAYFRRGELRCEDLTSQVCGGAEAMLPLELPPSPDQNFLVLGQIIATLETARFSPLGRRALLSMSLMQDWLQSCICPLRTRPEPEPNPDKPPDPEPDPRPGPVVDPRLPPVDAEWREKPVDFVEFVDRLVVNGYRRVPRKVPIDGPGPSPVVPDILINPAYLDKMARQGITTVNQMMTVSSATLGGILGISEQVAAAMQAEVGTLGIFARRVGG